MTHSYSSWLAVTAPVGRWPPTSRPLTPRNTTPRLTGGLPARDTATAKPPSSRAPPREALTCVTGKGGWEDRSEVSCPAYGFRIPVRHSTGGSGRVRKGAEGSSSGDKQLPSYQATSSPQRASCGTRFVRSTNSGRRQPTREPCGRGSREAPEPRGHAARHNIKRRGARAGAEKACTRN